MLVGMKMTAKAAALSSQLQDTSFNELGFEDRLGLLVTAEWNRRQTNAVKWLIHNAYEVLIEGRVSMRECNGLKSSHAEGGEEDA